MLFKSKAQKLREKAEKQRDKKKRQKIDECVKFILKRMRSEAQAGLMPYQDCWANNLSAMEREQVAERLREKGFLVYTNGVWISVRLQENG